MAQPSSLQADVQFRTLRTAQERRILQNPAEVRRGEVRSITIHVPLLSGRNDYLVVRMPDAAVRDLLSQAQALPQEQRTQFIREWVVRNQQAVLEQYIRSGGSERRFRYDVVPARAPAPRVSEATPRRTEERQPAPPVSVAVPRREQPSSSSGRRVIQPTGPSELPIERVPSARTARAELPPFPSQIRGGSGTRADPLRVYRTEAEVARSGRRRGGVSESIIQVPITLSIETFGDVQFRVAFTASQLRASARSATQAELWTIFERSVARLAAERGRATDRTAIREARRRYNSTFTTMVRQIESRDEDLAEYLREN